MFLHSHLIKNGKLKNSYEVSVAKVGVPEYLEWMIYNESGSIIQDNDSVRVNIRMNNK
jgi:hypothetical protein